MPLGGLGPQADDLDSCKFPWNIRSSVWQNLVTDFKRRPSAMIWRMERQKLLRDKQPGTDRVFMICLPHVWSHLLLVDANLHS